MAVLVQIDGLGCGVVDGCAVARIDARRQATSKTVAQTDWSPWRSGRRRSDDVFGRPCSASPVGKGIKPAIVRADRAMCRVKREGRGRIASAELPTRLQIEQPSNRRVESGVA